eukprot:gene33188-42919_t
MLGPKEEVIGYLNTTSNGSVVEVVDETYDGFKNKIYKYTIGFENCIEFSSTNFGATVLSLKTPNRQGTVEDITVQFPSLQDWAQNESHPYFGANPGRVANRIANGSFVLDGTSYHTCQNNGPNTLHGGKVGFDRRVWQVAEGWNQFPPNSDEISITFTYVSEDGEENFPGELHVSITYTVKKKGELVIKYVATTHGKNTIVNLTNHNYWNLIGDYNLKGSQPEAVQHHQLRLSCSRYLPVDDTMIPTGEIATIPPGSVLDFYSDAKELSAALKYEDPVFQGQGKPGVDHCFVIDSSSTAVPAAELYEPTSGRVMQLFTTQPGLQVYTGNFMGFSSTPAPSTVTYPVHSALCLEAQNFPDAINQKGFPSPVLRVGDTYEQEIRLVFTTRES